MDPFHITIPSFEKQQRDAKNEEALFDSPFFVTFLPL